MATTTLSVVLISFTPLLLLLSLQIQAQIAPAPTPSGPVNLTGILDKNGQYATFIRLLKTTQVADQVENELNSSSEGMTVFAPTNNAFDNLKSGTINDLTVQQQVSLVLYHILPKFYTLSNLLLVSNPVRTQATGQDGGVYGLNFTGQNNQVNVSTGVVETQINNALRQDFPLAVYQVDKVLLPEDLFGVQAPGEAPAAQTPPAKTSSGKSNSSVVASEPSPGNGSGGRNVALGLVVGLSLACVGVFS